MRKIVLLVVFGLLGMLIFAQEHDHNHGGQQSQGGEGELNATTEHMGAHMHMTELRKAQPGDAAKAQAVADQARQALERYRDYNVALADGYKIFLPNVPQKMYHFTSWQYAVGEAFRFDATKPTSLLYEKHGNDYKLIGAMYTAPVRFSEEQLNQRIPLSMAQWHQHVNMCRPPQGREVEMLGKQAKFGLNGSITTEQACDAAGGTFLPHVFGWMVHVYPWEKTPDEIWSVERQLKDKPASEHEHHDHGDMAGMAHQH
jgi:hypothetical protein